LLQGVAMHDGSYYGTHKDGQAKFLILRFFICFAAGWSQLASTGITYVGEITMYLTFAHSLQDGEMKTTSFLIHILSASTAASCYCWALFVNILLI
jgi:hypothetical protein